MNKRTTINNLLVKEISLYQEARKIGNIDLCINHLGRAHIISQGRWFHHFYIHFLMLELAWYKRNFKEVFGQIIRMIATIPGHITGRLSTGNIGWSTVGMFQKMPIPEDLKKHLST